MSFDLRDGIVRILKPNGETAGTGFVLTTDGLIATCAHVVQSIESQKRGEPKPEKTTIVFRATGESREVQIEPKWWRSSNKGEDVAILRVNGDLPGGVISLPLGSLKGVSNHPFDTFGFPRSNQKLGIWGGGHILGETGIQDALVRQLSSTTVTSGFSGAPVVDQLRRRVVGMVTSIIPPDEYGRLAETAFFTPIETLRDVCPVLKLSDICPYRNLEAFTEDDVDFFSGRDSVIDKLVSSLKRESRFLAVFGPSGCGKSSVVQAGLIPQLRRCAVPNSDRWKIEVTRPTDALFKQLVVQLEQSSKHEAVTLQPPSPYMAVIIDHFEELFVSFSKEECQGIINQLKHILENAPNLTLIIVMRNDFYSLFVKNETLAQWKQECLVDIPSTIKRDEVIAMVKEPAEAVGWQFEDEGLIEIIANGALETAIRDVQDSGSSTVLPLLEFALSELWNRCQNDGILTRKAYYDMGGVSGGLNQWAEQAYYEFEERLRPLVRRTFTALIYLDDKNRLIPIPDSRRRIELAELVHNESEEEDVYQVVQKLVESRLLIKNRDAQSGRVTVEIIHEALFQKWERLRKWIAEDRDFLVWRQKLDAKMQDWEASPVRSPKRDEDKLLRGSELENAWNFLESYPTHLNAHEQDFIKESKKRNQREVMRRRLVAVALLVLLIGALIASIAFVVQSNNVSIEKQHVKDQQALLASLPVSVTNLNDHGPGSLREATVQAPPGGAVTFAKTLRGIIRLTSGELKITKNLTISGPGAQTLAISGGNTTRVFNVSSNLIVSISNVTIRDGFTTQRSKEFGEGLGGGIYNDQQSTLALINVVVTENGADFGGGIYNHLGVLSLTDSTISHNTVRGDGGGIDNEGTLTITNSTVAYNTTAQDGGGIKNRNTLFLTNSTIAANTATGTGGGILNTEAGSSNINYSTIYGNMAQAGGGITIESGTGIMEASIVAGNGASRAPDISGTIKLYWPSLIQNTSGTNFSSGQVLPALQSAFELGRHSILGKSPMLGPLQNNGGQTQTYALLVGSPAIDQILPNDTDRICGANSFYPTDQRGKLRPQGAGCDLGAYEYVPS